MNTQEILNACDVLGWFSDQGMALAEDPDEGLAVALHMNVARMYLLDYLAKVQEGAEPYDAFLSSSRGELALGAQRSDLVRAIVEGRPAMG